jgi:cell division protein FtsI/penicillin-binding protein 2
MNLRRANKRLAWIFGLALVFLLVLFGRAFYIQVVAAAGLKAQATTQDQRTVKLAASRGSIFDRNGDQLAVSKPTATIYATPYQVKDAERASTAEQLSRILAIPQDELLTKLSGTGGFVYLARKVDTALGDEVRALKLPGIGVLTEDKRVYPKGALAPQLLGFVGTDNVGLAGIEKEYEAQLSGKSGVEKVVRDASGRRLATLSDTEAQAGSPVKLTIDDEIQFETEKVLAQTVKDYSAKRASAVVLDPTTGEVLAMADTPVFDTNAFSTMTPEEQRNSVVSDQYEPGSTFKTIVVAAALEAGLVTPQTKFKLAPTIQVYDRVVHEAEQVPAVRDWSVTQILAQSSNVGAVELGLEVSKQPLVDMIKRFGFTQKEGIDFPGEAAGSMLAPDKWSGTTIANVPIGQGISVTALQMATAYAAIANGGVLVQPHLVLDGQEHQSREVISPQVAAQLRDMLMQTVEVGTGTEAQVKGYKVAGKTGTAQKVKPGGGYYSDKFVSSFVGMVPADAPRLVILVVVDEPSGEHLAGQVAAPAFAKIADFSLKRLGIAPTSGN